MAEADALRSGAGVVARPRHALWEVSGTQALDYLHRMLTQDLRTLPAGQARPALALTREGRILGDPVVWGLGDRALLSLSAAAAASALPLLERYVIADDVTFSDRSDAHGHLALCGAGAPEALARALRADVPAVGGFVRASLGGGEALARRHDLGDRPGFDVVVDRGRLDDAVAALVRGGAAPVGEDAWDVARVETGTPAYGAELDERVLPNEAGLDDAVSWTKGCYLGQEPVVMARHRGHPPSLLCRLSIEGPPPPRDAELLEDGRRAGRVTTSVPSESGSSALGYVRWDSAREGALLSLSSGARAAVSAVLVAPRP